MVNLDRTEPDDPKKRLSARFLCPMLDICRLHPTTRDMFRWQMRYFESDRLAFRGPSNWSEEPCGSGIAIPNLSAAGAALQNGRHSIEFVACERIPSLADQ